MAENSQLVVCYALGTGAGFDTQLAGFSRQICEDFAECLALNEDFIAIPQMILVREGEELSYDVEKNACAFAVFYSLPETRWILDATSAIGGNIALTGRLIDDEGGVLLSISMVDVKKNVLLFCGCENSTREELHNAIASLAARALAHFTDRSKESWLNDVWEMIGTHNFHAYANWMGLREVERRAQREGLPAPTARLIEHACYALAADALFERAADKLCELLARPVTTNSCEFVVRSLANVAHMAPANALAYAQCLARLNRRDEAVAFLNQIVAKFPQDPVFSLLRGCLASDEKVAKSDLANAKKLYGEDFEHMKKLVESGLLNVSGV